MSEIGFAPKPVEIPQPAITEDYRGLNPTGSAIHPLVREEITNETESFTDNMQDSYSVAPPITSASDAVCEENDFLSVDVENLQEYTIEEKQAYLQSIEAYVSDVQNSHSDREFYGRIAVAKLSQVDAELACQLESIMADQLCLQDCDAAEMDNEGCCP